MYVQRLVEMFYGDIQSHWEFVSFKTVIRSRFDEDVNSRLTSANQAFTNLHDIWTFKKKLHKNKIFKSNARCVLLYGGECQKTTKTIENKCISFQIKCLRMIR